MTYEAEISRANPALFLFLIDQSGSMDERMVSGRTKAEFVADVLNRTLFQLVTICTKAEGVRGYFELGVVGYGGERVVSGFGAALSAESIHPIAAIEQHPLRIEERRRKQDDGAGGVVELPEKFPVWFDPTNDGGTPMCAALTRTAELLAEWCDAHPRSYPPTLLHVTDGVSTDGDPEPIAGHLRQLQTDDGQVLLFNLHVTTGADRPIILPDNETTLPDEYASLLYRMSSVLPESFQRAAAKKDYRVSASSRGFMYNARSPEFVVDFFEIGTRPSQSMLVAADR